MPSMVMIPPLEVCASSFGSAIAAEHAGASRIELCSSLEVGGMTPSIGLIRVVAPSVDIPIHVLIRPRSGGFVYSSIEIAIIKTDIRAIGEERLRNYNVVGVVFGVLNEQGEVNGPVMKELVDVARVSGLSVTFHRAFDDIDDWEKGLEDVIAARCERILSSGGALNCTEPAAMDRLRAMRERARGRISIMAGGGVTEYNVQSLVRATRVDEVHASCKRLFGKDQQEKSLFATDVCWETHVDIVERLMQVLSAVD